MTDTLTPKQKAFADGVLAGKALSQSYRYAYNAKGMSDAAVNTEASKLRKHAGISNYIDANTAKIVSDHGITADSHLTKLLELQAGAIQKGDHATAHRIQQDIAKLAKVDEPKKAAGNERMAAYREALEYFGERELDTYEAIRKLLHALVTDIEAGKTPPTYEERKAAGGELALGDCDMRTVSERPNGKCGTCELTLLHPRFEQKIALRLMSRGERAPHAPSRPVIECPACEGVPVADYPDSPFAQEMGRPWGGNNPMFAVPLTGLAVTRAAILDPVYVAVPASDMPPWWAEEILP